MINNPAFGEVMMNVEIFRSWQPFRDRLLLVVEGECPMCIGSRLTVPVLPSDVLAPVAICLACHVGWNAILAPDADGRMQYDVTAKYCGYTWIFSGHLLENGEIDHENWFDKLVHPTRTWDLRWRFPAQ